MLIGLLAALREDRERVSRGETGCATRPRTTREALLQRENALRAGMKKQHLPMKKAVFRLDSTSFSISIRTASECSFRWWFMINF